MSTTNTADAESCCYAVVYQAVTIELAAEQLQWIDSMILACTTGESDSLKNTTTTTTITTTTPTTFRNQSEVIRGVIWACMQAEDEAVVFGVIRCKSKVIVCEGAQAAVEMLRKRDGENTVNVNVQEEIQLL